MFFFEALKLSPLSHAMQAISQLASNAAFCALVISSAIHHTRSRKTWETFCPHASLGRPKLAWGAQSQLGAPPSWPGAPQAGFGALPSWRWVAPKLAWGLSQASLRRSQASSGRSSASSGRPQASLRRPQASSGRRKPAWGAAH